MKTPLFVLAAAGAMGMALAAPQQAQAGGVHLDVRIGVPAVVYPHVVYRPVVVYRPYVVYGPHVHHRDRFRHGHRHGHRHFRGGYRHGYAPDYERPRALGRIGPATRLQ